MTMKETFHTRSLSNEQVANHDRCQTLLTPEVQKKNSCHALQDVLKILVNNHAKLCWVSPTLSRFFITLCKDLSTCVLDTCSRSNFKGRKCNFDCIDPNISFIKRKYIKAKQYIFYEFSQSAIEVILSLPAMQY